MTLFREPTLSRIKGSRKLFAFTAESRRTQRGTVAAKRPLTLPSWRLCRNCAEGTESRPQKLSNCGSLTGMGTRPSHWNSVFEVCKPWVILAKRFRSRAFSTASLFPETVCVKAGTVSFLCWAMIATQSLGGEGWGRDKRRCR